MSTAADEAGWVTPRHHGKRQSRSEAQPNSPGDSPPAQVRHPSWAGVAVDSFFCQLLHHADAPCRRLHGPATGPHRRQRCARDAAACDACK